MTKIRNERQRTGKSLSAFSRDLGLHYSLASQIERGDVRAAPKWQAVIAKKFGISVEKLFDARGFAREVNE